MAAASALGACSTSLVEPGGILQSTPSHPVFAGQIPGFNPTPGERLGEIFVTSDMTDSDSFATTVCGSSTTDLTGPSSFVLKISGGASSSAGSAGGGNTAASSAAGSSGGGTPSSQGGGQGGAFAFTLALADHKTDTGDTTATSSTTTTTTTTPTTTTTKTTTASTSTTTTVEAKTDPTADEANTDLDTGKTGGAGGSLPVSKCSMKVIATAVNVCVYRTLDRNALDRALNLGIGEVLAVAGTAATIGSLTRTTGTNLGWVTGGAAILTALGQAGQSSMPSAASAQIPAIVNAGLAYLVLDNPGDAKTAAELLKNDPPAGTELKAFKTKFESDETKRTWTDKQYEELWAATQARSATLGTYASLFNASISQCALYTQ